MRSKAQRPFSFTEPELQALFGHEAAEDESIERLKQYYVKSATFEQVANDLPLRILVGHKGIGKSALFQIAIAEDREKNHLAVEIRPDDVVGIGEDVSDFLKTIREWKQGIQEIIARKVFQEFGKNDEDIIGALKRFGGKALDFLHETFKNYKGADYGKANTSVLNAFLKSKRINVYIDDLDRGWQGRRNDIVRISALLNATRDLVKESPGLGFRIGLRSDVYYLVRTSDESTDKIEGSVIWQSWTNHEIFILLVKRIESFFNRIVDEQELLNYPQARLAAYLDSVFEPRFKGRGHWENAPVHRVLMSLIRKRPRDLIKLCTLSGRHAGASRHTLIGTADLECVFEEYSQGRLQDTINEFRSELPEIERLLLNVRPTRQERNDGFGYVYTTDRLLNKIREICGRTSLTFANGKPAREKELAAFLYKVSFITARKDADSGIMRKYFEDHRYLSSTFVDFGFDWEVHPAYRWALQPEDISIYSSVGLSIEDK